MSIEEQRIIIAEDVPLVLFRIRSGFRTRWELIDGVETWRYDLGYEAMSKFERLKRNRAKNGTQG